MTTPEKLIDRFRRQLIVLLVARHAIVCLTAWAFAWGTAVLVLRATAGTSRLVLLWGVGGVPLALLAAVLLTRRQLPERSAVRALLDRHNGYGGMLMAGAECPLGRWQETLAEPVLPRLRWHGGRTWGFFAAGGCFLVAGFLVPERLAVRGSGSSLEVGREVARLSAQLEALKEENVLEPARAEDLQKKLTRVREEASGRDPVKTLEALDHVADVARQKAREAAEAALRKTEQLARAESLAEGLRKKQKKGAPDRLGKKARKEAMEELDRLTREAARDNELLRETLDKETLDALKENRLDPEKLKKLAESLRKGKEELARMLGKLEKVGLIAKDLLEECERCGLCDAEDLARFLKENEGKLSVALLLELWRKGHRPGRGAATRGPGAAELTFGKPSPEAAKDLKEEALPPGAVADLKASKLRGVSAAPPAVSKGGTPAASGALGGATAGGGSANTQVVLPRHRGAVERYFARPERSPRQPARP